MHKAQFTTENNLLAHGSKPKAAMKSIFDGHEGCEAHRHVSIHTSYTKRRLRPQKVTKSCALYSQVPDLSTSKIDERPALYLAL